MINTSMKINEVTTPSARAIFESIKDNDTFAQDTLRVISEDIAKFDASKRVMTVENFLKQLEEW